MNFALYLIILLISIVLLFHTKTVIIEFNNLKNNNYCYSKTDIFMFIIGVFGVYIIGLTNIIICIYKLKYV